MRFQNIEFRKSLKTAREYKRNAKTISQTPWAIFLRSVGLKSNLSRLLLVAALILTLYLLYFPNFLTVRSIQVEGVETTVAESVHDTVTDYFRQGRLTARQNLLLTSKTGLTEYLLQNNQKILQVIAIKKKFPATLVIQLIPRTDSYLGEYGGQKFILSNDGLVTKKLADNEVATTTNLTLLKLPEGIQPTIGQRYLAQNYMFSLEKIKNEAPGILNSPIDSFAFFDFHTADVAAQTAIGFEVYFDLKADAQRTLQELRLVLKEFSATDQKRLSYIDLRFKNKGFVCFKNQPCAVSATTSATSVLEGATAGEAAK